MTHLGETVDKDEDGIMAARFGEINDEVARDTPPRDIGDRDRCKLTCTLMLKRLYPGAEITEGNILFDKLVYIRKVIVSRKQLYSLYYAGMSC